MALLAAFAARHPRLRELLISLAILASSYVGARMLSFVFGKLLGRVVHRTATALDDELVVAVERPVAYLLFLVGAVAAVHRLPAPALWIARLDTLLIAVAIVLVALTLLRVYAIVLSWYTNRSLVSAGDGLAAEFAPLFSKLGNMFITLVALITLLQHFGVNVASLVVSLGVGSLAIGLAAQDTLSNMFAGFTLMLDRPFRIGDRIKLATGEVGDVESIGMRATRIRTLDETILIVPNSLLVKDRLVNQTRPARHITSRIEVAVAYGSDLAEVKRILAEAALQSPHVDRTHAPAVLVTRFADHAIIFLVAFWALDYAEQGLATSEVHEEIYRRLAEARIEIPFPTRRVIHEQTSTNGPGGPPAPAPAAPPEA
jgi:MscS family membrane protein